MAFNSSLNYWRRIFPFQEDPLTLTDKFWLFISFLDWFHNYWCRIFPFQEDPTLTDKFWLFTSFLDWFQNYRHRIFPFHEDQRLTPIGWFSTNIFMFNLFRSFCRRWSILKKSKLFPSSLVVNITWKLFPSFVTLYFWKLPLLLSQHISYLLSWVSLLSLHLRKW